MWRVGRCRVTFAGRTQGHRTTVLVAYLVECAHMWRAASPRRIRREDGVKVIGWPRLLSQRLCPRQIEAHLHPTPMSGGVAGLDGCRSFKRSELPARERDRAGRSASWDTGEAATGYPGTQSPRPRWRPTTLAALATAARAASGFTTWCDRHRLRRGRTTSGIHRQSGNQHPNTQSTCHRPWRHRMFERQASDRLEQHMARRAPRGRLAPDHRAARRPTATTATRACSRFGGGKLAGGCRKTRRKSIAPRPRASRGRSSADEAQHPADRPASYLMGHGQCRLEMDSASPTSRHREVIKIVAAACHMRAVLARARLGGRSRRSRR